MGLERSGSHDVFEDSDDPRLEPSYVRLVEGREARGLSGERPAADDSEARGASRNRAEPGDDAVGDALVLGVVHDHPASRHRVGRAVEAFAPDVVALEVAPLALGLFEARARDGSHPCEMTAAVAAAPEDARVVGVDGLGGSFVRTLLGTLRAEGATPGTVAAVVRSVGAVTRHAAACRLAALARRWTPLRLDVDDTVEHDCTPTDPADVQAADERRQVSGSFALLRASTTPAPVAVRDETREACMLERIDALRRSGDVAAVVGLSHLDVLADGLADL